MILHCNFEELAALNAAAARVLERSAVAHGVVAPAEPLEELEALLPRLAGDLSIESLADHVRVAGAVHENGMLHVDLVREVPEAMKPRRIEIARANGATPVIESKAETVN